MTPASTDRTQNSASLSDRLEQLERQNRRLAQQIRYLNGVVGIGLLAAVSVIWSAIPPAEATAQASRVPNILRAHSFVLVDKNNTERGSFAYNDADKVAALSMETAKDARISLSIGGDNLGLRMTHGKNDINLGYTPAGGTYFEMYDKDGKAIFEQRKP